MAELNAGTGCPGGEGRSRVVYSLPTGIEIRLERDLALNPPAVRVSMVLDERTREQDIRDAAPLAVLWNKAILELQGPDPGLNRRARLLEKLDRAHEEGASYTKLAWELNQQVEDSLHAWVGFAKRVHLVFDGTTYRSAVALARAIRDASLQALRSRQICAELEGDEAGEAGDIAGKLLADLSTNNQRARARLIAGRKLREAFTTNVELFDAWHIDCLGAIQELFPIKEANDLLVDGVERIEEGKPPFLPGCPIFADLLRSKVRAWCVSHEGRGSRRRRSAGKGARSPRRKPVKFAP